MIRDTVDLQKAVLSILKASAKSNAYFVKYGMPGFYDSSIPANVMPPFIVVAAPVSFVSDDVPASGGEGMFETSLKLTSVAGTSAGSSETSRWMHNVLAPGNGIPRELYVAGERVGIISWSGLDFNGIDTSRTLPDSNNTFPWVIVDSYKVVVSNI